MTWDQFIASMLALAAIAAYRLVNRYLPPRTQAERQNEPESQEPPL